MKKIAAILLALMLLVLPASAMNGAGYPAYEGGNVQNALGGSFGSENLKLEFDASADYSYLRDGYIQGCFFAFDASEAYYLELYLLLPEKMQAGDVLTPASCFADRADSCSISLFEVDENNNEQAWFAGQLLGEAYPQNSNFSIAIDRAEYGKDSVSVSGTIAAELCRIAGEMPADEVMTLNASFDFELPLNAGAENEKTEQPKAEHSLPAPKFTLPPDYITL